MIYLDTFEKKNAFCLIGSLAILSILLLVAVTPASVAAKSGTPGRDSCVDNGYLTVQVDDSNGIYTFDIGTCADLSGSTCVVGTMTNFPDCNYILYPSGTSFASVNDFTTGVTYTENGDGGGTSLGTPASSTVVGNSIVTVFPATAEGLVVTQTITVAGTTAPSSVIEMKITVQNTNTNPQNIGIRYLWDTQVGGYDGTWLQQFDGATAGAITGYETDFNSPPATFTSYAMGGCSQGDVIPPPYTCDPANFGSGSGTFSVFGSISSGPGATTPAQFVYGYWGAQVNTAYAYTPNALNEIGSYIPNNDGGQDSAMLYYFPTYTIPSSGTLSDQADISNAQSAVITVGTTTTTTSSSTGTVAPSTSVTDLAAVAAVPPTAGTPTGSVQFYFCGPTGTATSCAAVLGNAVGSPVALSGGSATSTAESPSAVGFYCWSAIYTPDTSVFTGSSSTTTTNECFQVVAPTTTTTTATTTVISPTTTTQTASTTSTSAPATTTTTSLASTTGTVMSTSSATSTAKSTTTILSGNCYDPTTTVTSTATHFTTITQTTTATYYATATGTQTVTATSTETFTTTSVVPVTTTITEVSSTTECSTTVSSSSSTVVPPLGVPEFPVPGIAVMLAAICLFAVVLFRRSLRPTTKARV